MSRAETVRKFLVENFLFGEEGKLQSETSFMESGIIDSTGILELVAFVEKQFGIKVENEEMVPENLDSLVAIEAYLARKSACKPSPAPAGK